MRELPVKQLNLLLFLFSSGCFLSLTACRIEEPEEKKIVEDYPFSSFDPPLEYNLADPECQKHKSSTRLTTVDVWGWQGLSILNTRFPIQSTQSEESITSRVISSTSYGREFTRVCDMKKQGGADCQNQFGENITYLQKSDENYLRVCKDNYSYGRESVEGIALTSVYYLNKASEFYRRVTGNSLSQVRLDVLPKFQTIYLNFPNNTGGVHNVGTWLTNNLAYYPKNKLIAIFPENRKKAETTNDHYWESAFVLAHELGHHIEEDLAGEDREALHLHWSPEHHAYVEPGQARTLTAENDDERRRRMWSALSEGFADLNGYYANDASSFTLHNISCIGKNRDVGRPFYYDEAIPKKLTTQAINSMLGPKAQSQFCGEVNYTDPHIVGASLAFALDQIFQAVVAYHHQTPSRERVGRVEDRAQLAYVWYKAMVKADKKEKRRNLSSPSELFQPMATAIEEAVDTYSGSRFSRASFPQQGPNLHSVVCRKAKDLLPALSTPPFARECSR